MDNEAGSQLQQRRPWWYTLSVPASVHDEVTSTQIPLQATKRTHFQKINDVLQSFSFESLGGFLSTLFYCHPRQSELSDPQTLKHQSAVTAFLHGDSKVTMGHVISLIYNHRQSQPKASSVHVNDALLSFSTITSPAAIHHAWPALSAWAAQLIGNEVYREIGRLTKKWSRWSQWSYPIASIDKRAWQKCPCCYLGRLWEIKHWRYWRKIQESCTS